ncbi:MAG: hypothetical protein NVS3B21_29740 [Acidimicrobiales bacterium]
MRASPSASSSLRLVFSHVRADQFARTISGISYAVHALEKMVDDGTDIYVALPLLATYMGHADIQSTEYYLRFTTDTLLRIIDAQQQTSQRVFEGAS